VGRIHARLGRLSWKLKRRKDAQEHLGRAAEILKAQLGSDRAETQGVLSDYAESMRRRAYSGRAEPRLREAWHAVQKATGPYGERELPDHQARRAERLGEEYYRSGRLDRAEMMYQRALRQWLPLLGPDHPRVIRTRWRLARISRRLADPHEVPPEMSAPAVQEFWGRCERLSWIVSQGSPAHE
jgi:tetratricopeptide (TPR) repeat protein